MPMDIDMDIDADGIDEGSGVQSAQIPELPGIQVVGKERATWYINSVSYTLILYLLVTC
jgi:hypothetical protein